MNKIGIYIHVPFCVKKCPYCDFFSVKATDDLLDKYVERICYSIKKWSSINRVADSLYFGGGTPSILGANRISVIVECAKRYFGINLKKSEITVEMNPCNCSSFDFKLLRSCGVNRLSIGVQSSKEKELQILGRLHTADMAAKTVFAAQKAGFDNISVDLMIAIPEQTRESLLDSINFCVALDIQHVSAYILKIEEGTQYYSERDILNLPEEDMICDLYLTLCEELKKHEFYQYEISNFSKKTYQSRHNLKYWNDEEYLGFGPSAHSFINKKRFYYKRSMENFFLSQQIINDGFGGSEDEYIMLQLRLCEGLSNTKFKKRFGKSIPKKYFQNALKFKDSELICLDQNHIKLTPKGFLVSNELIRILLN